MLVGTGCGGVDNSSFVKVRDQLLEEEFPEEYKLFTDSLYEYDVNITALDDNVYNINNRDEELKNYNEKMRLNDHRLIIQRNFDNWKSKKFIETPEVKRKYYEYKKAQEQRKAKGNKARKINPR